MKLMIHTARHVARLLLLIALPAVAATKKPVALADSAAVVAMLNGVTNGACPLPGVATGGQPSADHAKALAKAGFTTVLDLRTADEDRGYNEAAAMKAAKLAYELLPVTPATLDDATFDRFRELMQKTGGKGVFVHCASGNRVGAVMVPWLVLDRGWPLEQAVTSAKAGGTRSEPMLEKARDYVSRHTAK
jgi:uncharacterized protein (TIGR01244 family)